tara:strand:- start:13590 stop:14735 length:1146 start_codon:yes stop_codon:yes gene_type:complete
MAENSKIEWTHHTANLWWGCTKVHAGCDNCYALTFAKRVGNDIWGNDKPRRMIKDVWSKFRKFQKEAEKQNEVHRVFVGSMMDIFEKPMPLVDHDGNPYSEGESEFWNTRQLRDKFFNEVVPNSPNLMFLLLTKRPSNINKYIPESWKENPPKNVMFGTSPVSQETANKLILQLSEVNGLRFLSVEPQLEKIDLMTMVNDETDRVLLDMVDWVIQGGESGHHRRPFDTDWGRLLRDDCKKKGVPFFFKQIDKKLEIPQDLLIREFPTTKTEILSLKKTEMKTKMKKLKCVTVEELRVINDNSTKAKFSATYDIDGLINDGILSDIPDFAYSVQLCMVHENQDGSSAMRVYVSTNTRFKSIILDMTEKDYDGLFKMKFRVVA